MIVQALAFYMFSFVAVAAGVLVIASRNPVHSVLFLFVVMMLDINFVELRRGVLQYLPIGALIGILLLVELLVVLGGWVVMPQAASIAAAPIPPLDQVTNTQAIGRIIYTDYFYLFQAAGLILLVAMIGAIVLTLRKRPGVRRQKIADQLDRKASDAIEIVKVTTGSGI